MRRYLMLALALLLSLSLLGTTVLADVLWEPDNSFYRTHAEECTYVGRGYAANSPQGFVTIWVAPEGGIVKGQVQNGVQLTVYWQYEQWGCVSLRGDEKWIEGWVSMAEMSLLYDHIAFAEAYADQIRPYDGEFSDYAGDAAGVNFYAYPGADSVQRYWAFSDGDVLRNLTGSEGTGSYIQSVFTDEDGRTWGFVGYMYGRMNAWFCLDDPDGLPLTAPAEEIAATGLTPVFPVRQVEQAEIAAPQQPHLPFSAYLPYGLVGVAVLATAALLVVFFRKKKKA